MKLSTKFKNQIAYDQATGVLKWKQSGSGRKKDLTLGSIHYQGRGKQRKPYRRMMFDGKVYSTAQVIWTIMTGEFPDFPICHRDGNALNEAWDNLMRGDNGVIQKNKVMDKRNKSGHQGVDYMEADDNWRATIGHQGKSINLGRFDTFELARDARVEAEKKYGYSERHGTQA